MLLILFAVESSSTPSPVPSPTTLVPSSSNVFVAENNTDSSASVSWALVAGVFMGSTGFSCLTIVVLLVMFLFRKPASRRLDDVASPSENGDCGVTLRTVTGKGHPQPNSVMELFDIHYEKEPKPPGGLQQTGTPTESDISYTPSHVTGDTAYASGHCNDESEVFSERLDHRGGVPSTVGSIDPSHLGGIWF